MKHIRNLRRCGSLGLAVSVVTCLAAGASAEDTSYPGIISAYERSAVISAADMPQGSEMWAMWVSLPPGKTVDHPGSGIGKWIDLQLVLDGRSDTVDDSVTGGPDPCVMFRADGRQEPIASKTTVEAGDGYACNPTLSSKFRETSSGDGAFIKAQLDIGGPWAPGMGDTPQEYRDGGGAVEVAGLDAQTMASVEKDIRATGAMRVSIRRVTIPSGTRMIVTDPYPVLRLISNGEVQWGVLPPGARAGDAPAKMLKRGKSGWLLWDSTTPQQIRLITNAAEGSAEIIEWRLAPEGASR
jgi:hypothetical protein